jgi:hypothetical protein
MESVDAVRKRIAEETALGIIESWRVSLPKIRESRESLKTWFDQILDESKPEGRPMSKGARRIERRSFNKIVGMDVDEISRLTRRFYDPKLSHEHESTPVQREMSIVVAILRKINGFS